MPQKQPRLSFVACRLSSKEDRFSRVPEKTPLFWFYCTCEVSSLFCFFVWLFDCYVCLIWDNVTEKAMSVFCGIQTVIQGRSIFKSAREDAPFLVLLHLWGFKSFFVCLIVCLFVPFVWSRTMPQKQLCLSFGHADCHPRKIDFQECLKRWPFFWFFNCTYEVFFVKRADMG